MKNKKFPLRAVFWIIIAILVVAYPLFWLVEIATIPENPDQFIDPTALSIAVAIIIGVYYYAALWLASLIYEIILLATKRITKRSFFIALGILFSILIMIGTVILLLSL